MAIVIMRRSPQMAQISIHFLPHFILLQFNPTYMKRILHLIPLKNIGFLNLLIIGSNIDILRLLRPLTANY